MPLPESTTVDNSRDDISAALSKLESAGNTPAGDPPPPPQSPVGDPPKPSAGATPPAPGASSTPGQPGAAAAAPAGATPPAPVVEVKPPASWKPEMHAHWKTLPAPVQQEVLRREREIGGLQQGSAQAREFMGQFQQIAQPYQQYFAMYGNNNPLEAFRDYLQTVSILRMGSPQERASRLAMAVHEFGVDIQLLDGYLTQIAKTGGLRVPGGQQPGHQPGGQQQFRDPRVDQLLEYQETQLQESVATELETFAADPKHEFYEQVRGTMADYLDFQASRNVRVTLQQAYDYACKMDDTVQATMTQRSAQTAAARGAQAVAAARAAATPGAGAAAPARTPTATGTGTRADDIRESIDKLTSA